MKLTDRLRWDFDLNVKSLPSQEATKNLEPSDTPTYFKSFFDTYNKVEAVRRGVDMVVDSCAGVNFDILERHLGTTPLIGSQVPRAKRLYTALNVMPNPDENLSIFRRRVYMDLILTGNAFIYWDGANLYTLPAKNMRVEAGNKSKIEYYEYLPDNMKYYPDEMIHIQDNSASEKIVGMSRLCSSINSINVLYSMLDFQQGFFKNGAVPGLVLTTPNILGKKIKERLIEYWQRTYRPNKGGRTPLVLDGDFKIQPISTTTFKELDFEKSIEGNERKILEALGVPPILLDGGNNANIAPNLRLFYLTTVLPLVEKVASAFEAFFAYDLKADVTTVTALQPELRDQSAYYSTLVNTGIMTPNEARKELRMEEHSDPGANELRVPANIAGSAANPSEGGRPVEDDGENIDD